MLAATQMLWWPTKFPMYLATAEPSSVIIHDDDDDDGDDDDGDGNDGDGNDGDGNGDGDDR
jgi:hypothetical protein